MAQKRTLETKLVYQNRWLRVREDHVLRQNGTKGMYTYVERDDSVIIVPLSPSNRTVMLRQYRYPTDGFSWELPMGGIEQGETPEDAVRRELLEETQLSANSMDQIGYYCAVPGLTPQRVSVFVIKVADEDLDEVFTQENADDIVEARVIPVDEVYHMVSNGDVTDGFTLVGLLYLHLYLNGNAR